MTDEAVLYEKIGTTAVITLNRPQKRNALDGAVARGMLHAVAMARDDVAVRTVVLTGAGGAFCSGADLAGDSSCDDPVFFGRDTVLGHQRWFSALIELEKPVIAAVDGPAVGAGFSLALAADFIFVTPRTRFMASFLSMGLVPDLSMFHVLPRLVGLARAKEIVFSARAIGAEEALSIGLAQALAPAEELMERTLSHASQFDNAPPRALALAKSLLNRSFETDRATMNQLEASAQSLCGASQYHAEAVRRFLAKEGLAYTGAIPMADEDRRGR
ncbi:enoyl-CoA hydratase/isomerase family protein [Metapseudomonas lalkuanensis]|uniref:Enoyl-CoA hydratase/isomerase family protein n=1 Tax=Metapseudomonas lalkuanensis TaxID=2604832 RepID=A0A5J6QMF4_9GAMM|nr:enoyl-CoA hydratase/isomerase family protein [Pseudomonas lalkuanensis]QEY62965.1 enoyl-CoA hydratase/isomerase family protein [Pseudomonas lalkuanensis]